MTEAQERRVGQVCLGWWGARIRPDDDTADAKLTRAALRRVASPVEAVGVEAVHDLNARLDAAGHGLRREPDRLMLIAVALAHVKGHVPGRRAALAFGEPIGERRRLGGIRFEALIRARSPEELARPLVRALAVIDGRADAAALADDLFRWTDRVRTQWCFDYYGAPAAAPASDRDALEAIE